MECPSQYTSLQPTHSPPVNWAGHRAGPLLSMPSASVGVPDLSFVQWICYMYLSAEVGRGIFTHPWRLLPAFAVARGGRGNTAVFIYLVLGLNQACYVHCKRICYQPPYF
jgi:hypothetical protein